MSALPDIQWGIDWNQTARDTGRKSASEIHLMERHQRCAFWNMGKGAYYHRKERITAFWPDYQWHRWNERRLKALCDYRWVTWLGPGSSTKSCDAAVSGLEFYLQAPDRTAVVVCSTTMKLLRKRIWNYMASYHSKLPKHLGNVGELLDTETMIRWQKGDSVSGVFGMAVEEGPVDVVMNNLIGIHPQRYLLILDEAQGVREAIMGATFNMAKNPWFGAVLMGNPDDMQNPLLRESEPIGGWGNTLDKAYHGEIDEWETLGGPTKGNGICQFFDGRKSPADDSPAERERLSFMINADWRADHLKGIRGNTGDPSWWSQVIGLPPPKGITSTVLDLAMVLKFNCREPAVWTSGFFRWASLDPSFEGGDERVLTIGRCGETEGRWVIGVDEQIEVPIDVNSTEPLHYQIANWVIAYLTPRGIGPDDFALDSSGEGGGLKSIFDQMWGVVTGIEFGGSPSDTPISSKPGVTAKEEYDRRSSELNFNVREFAQANGLRGLPEQSEKDLCERRTFYRNKKYRVEGKGTFMMDGKQEKGFKSRTGRSPDHGDSLAIGVALCIEKGAVPAVMDAPQPAQKTDRFGDDDFLAQKERGEFDPENYLLPA